MPDATLLHIAYLSIGSNIEPQIHLQAAVTLLRRRFNVFTISSVYQSPAFGFADQPDFLDVVVGLTTVLDILTFKQVLHDIEQARGRDRASQLNPNGPLTLDMDILLWDKKPLEYGSKPWRVPHPNILKFAAIALPLAECVPKFVHPDVKKPLHRIAAEMADERVRPVSFRVE